MTQIEGFAVKHSDGAGTREVVEMEPSGEPGVRWEFWACTQRAVFVCVHQKLNNSDRDRPGGTYCMCWYLSDREKRNFSWCSISSKGK